MTNAYAQYKNQSLAMMTQGEILVKLFDESIKQCHLAKLGLEKNDFITVNQSLNKAQTILSTLAGSLDMRYPVSKELHDMYVFFAKQIDAASAGKSFAPIEGILPLLKELRNTFDQAEKLSRSQHAVGGQAV